MVRSLWIIGDDNEEAHESQDSEFKPDIVVEPYGKHAHVRQIPPHFSHNILFAKPFLPPRVQSSIIHVVVVSLGQNIHVSVLSVFRPSLLLLSGDHSMHDGYGLGADRVHYNIPCS